MFDFGDNTLDRIDIVLRNLIPQVEDKGLKVYQIPKLREEHFRLTQITSSKIGFAKCQPV